VRLYGSMLSRTQVVDWEVRRYIGLHEEDIYKLPGNFFPEMPTCLITIEMASFCFTPQCEAEFGEQADSVRCCHRSGTAKIVLAVLLQVYPHETPTYACQAVWPTGWRVVHFKIPSEMGSCIVPHALIQNSAHGTYQIPPSAC
jgi:hypothetical protein